MIASAYKTDPPNHPVSWFFPCSNFNGKEKDYESGFHYYGARYHWSEVLTGWLSVDPMMDKYPNISPYNYCMWNPVKLVDPDGRFAGDFYAMNFWGKWKKIGSDGKNDGKTYLVTNFKDIQTIKQNTRKRKYTSVNQISEPICLPSKDIRRQMSNVVEYDNDNNLREYGGKGFVDCNGNMFIRELNPGPIWSGFGNAEIDMTNLKDNSNINTDAVFWYHSHPSGTVDVDGINYNYIDPTPSEIDKDNIKGSGRKYDYVFGLYGRNPQVYIYDASGIRAQLSVDEFKNIGE